MTAPAGRPGAFSPLDPARFSFRPVDPVSDAPLLHPWVTHPKAGFWLMGDAGVLDVERAYADIAQAPYQDAFIGRYDRTPAFLMERYDPARVELDGLYDAEPGDIGMHFLVAPAPAGKQIHGFTRAVIAAVMAELFSDPATRRVVVEPDIRNAAVHVLNKTVGFEIVRQISKPEKDAYLSICTREQFEATR
ncbi:Protein N-acetyltransferase, RimJ/RimL family [Streptomyces sp. DvalAA-14]|uniref:GNAT family N-acetyltransferase n=1 Tax=unclassified Streptomyces TaxID=2593676 RepID=UPI00081B04C4|nr:MULTISPECIES: GNAT family N-acetyltransferase [unclassified Streptomyces]MYS22957.1 GNAT family N-acetyltransferase [Streptomyces sp. SID4948]SCE25100.1 Protein N-acetyltransferase, RimJ/RimL family [Streptomyces sp. DvalAA-14]